MSQLKFHIQTVDSILYQFEARIVNAYYFGNSSSFCEELVCSLSCSWRVLDRAQFLCLNVDKVCIFGVENVLIQCARLSWNSKSNCGITVVAAGVCCLDWLHLVPDAVCMHS